MADFDHLHALRERLQHERARLADAKTNGERELRTVWVAQIEKEIGTEVAHLESKGLTPPKTDEELLEELMSDEELLAELSEQEPTEK